MGQTAASPTSKNGSVDRPTGRHNAVGEGVGDAEVHAYVTDTV
jgi:hypothetical protein